MPGWHQDITLAELWAFWAFVAHLGPAGGVFHTDCRNLVQGFARGREYCTDAFSIYSGIWRRIWAKIEDVGEHLVQVEWMPAHMSEAKARDEGLEEWKRQANQWADTLAKEGARRHEGLEEIKGIIELTDLRVHFVWWLVCFQIAVHLWLFKHKMSDYSWPARERQADYRHGGLMVTRCPPSCKRKLKRRKQADLSHALSRNGDLVWCRRCGCWAQARIFLLAGSCRPLRLEQYPIYRKRLAALRAGRHPVSGAKLAPMDSSWLGFLEEDREVEEQQQRTVVERTSVIGRPFLCKRRHQEAVALDKWLAKLVELLPDVRGKRRGKDSPLDIEEEWC